MRKIYLAALYGRREELEGYANRLTELGHNVVSQWVFGNEQGLTREEIALLDIYDVDRCDLLVAFTEPYGEKHKGGGRHIETGYAMARGKEICIIGDRENVFHHHPMVKKFESVDELIRSYTTQVS